LSSFKVFLTKAQGKTTSLCPILVSLSAAEKTRDKRSQKSGLPARQTFLVFKATAAHQAQQENKADRPFCKARVIRFTWQGTQAKFSIS